jgi:hypothetical protein
MLMFCLNKPQICAVFGAVSISNNRILIKTLSCLTYCNAYIISCACLVILYSRIANVIYYMLFAYSIREYYASLTLNAADNIGNVIL